jgi:hypothetical protein
MKIDDIRVLAGHMLKTDAVRPISFSGEIEEGTNSSRSIGLRASVILRVPLPKRRDETTS